MVVCGDVRRTFAEVQQRSRSLASFLRGRGIGLRSERQALERWECGQDPVALVLHNGTEYVESMLGAFRARAVPFNVNQHYRPAELGTLVDGVGARAAVYHRRYGPLLAEAVDVADLVLVDVDDGSGVEPLPGSTTFEDAARTPIADLPEPSPDDLYVVCTGGTTGRPKAVLWRQGDIYLAGMAGVEDATPGVHRGGRPVEHRGAVVPGAAADARRGAVDRVLRAARRIHGPAPRRLSALRCRRRPREHRARGSLHGLDRRRRPRPSAGRGAPAAHLRPLARSSCWAPAARRPAST